LSERMTSRRVNHARFVNAQESLHKRQGGNR
jgi:hypothetical protein